MYQKALKLVLYKNWVGAIFIIIISPKRSFVNIVHSDYIFVAYLILNRYFFT